MKPVRGYHAVQQYVTPKIAFVFKNLVWFFSCTRLARLFRGFDCLDTLVRPTRLAVNIVNRAVRSLREIRIVPRVACAKGFLRSDQTLCSRNR